MKKLLAVLALNLAISFPLPAQQQIPINSGSLTIPAASGTYRVLLNQNVTSVAFGTASGPIGGPVSVLFVENSTGGYTVTGYASNILNTSSISIATTAGAVTPATFLFDSGSNSWAVAGGGGGGISGSGAANTVTKWTGTSAVGNSTITDDGTNPTRFPNGVNEANAGNYQEYTNDAAGTANEKLACVTSNLDGNGEPTISTCAAGSTSGLVGVVESGAGTSGTALVCWTLNCSVLFTNSTTPGHVAIVDPTTPGELQDTGGTTSTAGFQPFSVLKANTGAGTASPVSISGLLAQNPTGGGGGGKGTAVQINGVGTKGTANFQNTATITFSGVNSGNTTTVTAVASGSGGGGYSSVNNQTVNYTTVLGDANGLVTENVAAANTVTIPPNSSVAYTIGTVISLTQLGAGQSSFAADAGVTINTPTSLSCRAQYSLIMVTKIATDTWVAAGDLQ